MGCLHTDGSRPRIGAKPESLGGTVKRVTGIGGIFFKAKDAPALQAWYKRHLGIDEQEWAALPFVGSTT
jgi:hypothetical protein